MFQNLTPRQLHAFTLRSVAGLLVLVVAGLAFGLLLGLVQSAWGPLQGLDRGIARQLSEWVSGNPTLLSALQIVTTLGDPAVLTLLLGLAAAWLLIRRRPRLASYVVVTGLGAAILTPVTKTLVDRTRPLVGTVEGGASFPSGHALGSIVVYGVLLLVFLPAMNPRVRPFVAAATGLLVLAIGFTRLALGVHFLTDVLGGWLLGFAWLGVTASAFQRWRRASGLTPVGVSRGLEPEAEPELEPAPNPQRDELPHPWRALATLLMAWVLVLGLVYGTGLLVTTVLPGTVDRAVVQWFAAHRGDTWTALAEAASWLGSVTGVAITGVVAAVLALAATRRWRPVLFLFAVMAGEVTLYLVASRTVDRRRPEVPTVVGHGASSLGEGLPNLTSFPSGHVAAAAALYGGIAVLVLGTARGSWRWGVLGLAVVIPLLVAVARLYLGLHYPTDYLGSLLVAVPWLLACWWTLRPTARSRAGGQRCAPVTARSP